MWYLIYIHFSVPANFVTVVHLDVFCLTQFYFDKYLSFILNFVPHYCDCLCDTFLKVIWKSVHWHFNISINNKVLFFPYKNLEKTESSNSQSGWLLNCFFLSFSNHKNYSIKNICVYSKSKIKTKVTNKQNLEHFRIINRKLFIPKFCDNSKMLLSSSWAIFIRALVFSFSTRVNFSSFEYLRFLFY